MSPRRGGTLLRARGPSGGLSRQQGCGVLFCQSLFLLKSATPAVSHLGVHLPVKLSLRPSSAPALSARAAPQGRALPWVVAQRYHLVFYR